MICSHGYGGIYKKQTNKSINLIIFKNGQRFVKKSYSFSRQKSIMLVISLHVDFKLTRPIFAKTETIYFF